MFPAYSYYSWRFGCMSEEALLALAAKMGYRHLALTDVHSMSGAWNFLQLAPRYGIHPVVGMSFHRPGEALPLYVGLACSRHGLYQLNTFLSHYIQRGEPLPDRAPPLPEVHFVYPLRRFYDDSSPALERLLQHLRFSENEWVGIAPEELHYRHSWVEKIPPSKAVIWHPMLYATADDVPVHRLLRAIDANSLWSSLPDASVMPSTACAVSADQLRQRYRGALHLIRHTEMLLESCRLQLDDRAASQNLDSYTGDVREDFALLRTLALDGLHRRYGDEVDEALIARLEKELDIIRRKGFVAYFLINWDIVQYARRKGYLYTGRGSGANSLVAYLLDITDVDPVELDLYFERFINLHRQSPPDFDIDFAWRDREDVIRYIFRRYRHTALLATYQCFHYRSAVRETAKVFGLPPDQIERLAEGHIREAHYDKRIRTVLQLAARIQGFPNYLGIHAGGILIAKRPIHDFSPTFIPPKGYPTVQFDMIVAEQLGLHKFDILSQRGLPKIREALHHIRRNHPHAPPIDIHDLRRFVRDPEVRRMLRQGDTIGCFYIESPAMRMLLKKLRVSEYRQLVAASSIIRPGVARSGMMDEYILRAHHPQLAQQRAHPKMLELLPETYGIMVYQEDVIRVAHLFAGLSLADADVLRRAMSGKYRSKDAFQRIRDKFFRCCRQRGYDEDTIRQIWHQIESFAGYAFAKGHSASYAVESYQCLYLKAHWPLEFMVAVINNGGGFYDTETYLREAQRLGARIHPPCVNRSELRATLHGRDIFLGLSAIRSLPLSAAQRILDERRQRGPFRNLTDFIERLPLGIETLRLLIRADALRFTGNTPPTLLWHAHFLHAQKAQHPYQPPLFTTHAAIPNIPSLHYDALQRAYDQMELLGFPLCSPFQLLPPHTLNPMRAALLPHYTNKTITIYGYLITAKWTRTVHGQRMCFGTFADADGQWFDTVHFPKTLHNYPLRGRAIYRITGKVTEAFGTHSITVYRLEKIPFLPDPRQSHAPSTPPPLFGTTD